MLANRFGHFDAAGSAFTITDPATPMPWVNVICNGRYGLVVSQNGGGFSWYDDAQHNVLTRWEMDLVRDVSGKYIYIADRDSGEVWSAAPAPTQTRFDEYACTHTMGASTITTKTRGIRCAWTLTVAPDDAVELWRVALTNTTDKPRRLRVSSYFDWCCGVAPDSKREFHRLFFTTSHDSARRAILATKNMWDIPHKSERDHWNQPWPYFAAHAICGASFENEIAIADKSRFMGRYTSLAAPQAMTAEGSKNGGFGRVGDAAAALGGDITLQPGQTVSFHYLLAIADNEQAVLQLVDKFASPAAAEKVHADALTAWKKRLAPTTISSQRADFDLLNNHWLPYQAISARMWGRTGYYQQSGARGYRDQLQDSQVWLPIEPSRTLDQIMLHATRQFENGSVNHWWHALADFGNRTACSDDYLWLPFVLAAYLRETGDFAALNRTAPFMDAGPATLMEHCRRSFARAFYRTSQRGIPHIGSCDWNDGLSAMGIEEKGESVWVGMFLAHLLEQWAEIGDRINEPAMAADYRARREKYVQAINAHAWDGAWYRYGTKDSGEWVGASACAEGKIHLNAQTWSILADVAPAERASRAWDSVKQHLLSPYGPLLLAPAYTVPDVNIGYVTRYTPGSRENGGVYMHAATWALAAAAKVGDHEAVERIWNSISPAHRGQDADSYWAEPFVTPGNVDGPLSDLPGRAGWTWYTGSAAWLNRVSLEWVVGIRPTFEGLSIRPCPPASLGQVRVKRRWRGTTVALSFDAGQYEGGMEPTLTVNGQPFEGSVLPPSLAAQHQGGLIEVEATWRPRTHTGAASGLGKVRK